MLHMPYNAGLLLRMFEGEGAFIVRLEMSLTLWRCQ